MNKIYLVMHYDVGGTAEVCAVYADEASAKAYADVLSTARAEVAFPACVGVEAWDVRASYALKGGA